MTSDLPCAGPCAPVVIGRQGRGRAIVMDSRRPRRAGRAFIVSRSWLWYRCGTVNRSRKLRWAAGVRGMRGSIRARIAMWLLVLVLAPALAGAEDGYDLWLRYRPVDQAASERYRPHAAAVVATSNSPTMRAAVAELQT